jgi:hypothetical protein
MAVNSDQSVKYCLLTAVLVAPILFSSCRTEEGGLMKDLSKAEVGHLRSKYVEDTNPATTSKLQNEIDNATTAQARNNLLNDLTRAIDLNYYHWEKLLYDKKSFSDFGVDTAVLGLGSAGTYGVAASTVKVLSAISASLTGTRAAFDSNVLQKQAIPAIMAKMRALRAERMKYLRNGMMKRICEDGDACKKWHYIPRDLDQYSVGQGLNDIVAYYNAGTFVGAIAGIQADAGEQEKKNQKETAAATNPTPAPSP